jgi:hypothetical protein
LRYGRETDRGAEIIHVIRIVYFPGLFSRSFGIVLSAAQKGAVDFSVDRQLWLLPLWRIEAAVFYTLYDFLRIRLRALDGAYKKHQEDKVRGKKGEPAHHSDGFAGEFRDTAAAQVL